MKEWRICAAGAYTDHSGRTIGRQSYLARHFRRGCTGSHRFGASDNRPRASRQDRCGNGGDRDRLWSLNRRLAVVAPISALVTALAVAIAAASATLIQFWFSVQAKRSHFRRRQTSSRIATFAEALSSFSWAGVGALAAARTWLAIIPGLIGLAIVACAWIINPAKSTTLDAGRPRRNEPLEVSQAELKPSLSMAMFTGG